MDGQAKIIDRFDLFKRFADVFDFNNRRFVHLETIQA
jgi:hypothetical protein